MSSILCVDDDPAVGLILDDTLRRAGHRTKVVRHVPDALRALATGDVDLVVCDYRMPGISGLEFLGLMRLSAHDVPVVMLTAYAAAEHAVAAMRAGAIGYVTKPVRPQQLQVAVEQALAVLRLRQEADALRREVRALRRDAELIGESAAMRRLRQAVAVAASSRAPVLLEGERGTGKDLIARAIHDASDRCDGPFLAIDCAEVSGDHLEHVLFGREEGDSTAAEHLAGAFERADRGTLLLDQLDHLPQELQARLLRFLQERRGERSGQTAGPNVRLILATRTADRDEKPRGAIRSDLVARLGAVAVSVPPLRDRPDDIPRLALHFTTRAAEVTGKPCAGISPEALDRLQRAAWPGNVRELRDVLERAVLVSAESMLTARDLEGLRASGFRSPPDSWPADAARPEPEPEEQAAPRRHHEEIVLRTLNVDDAERMLIQRALQATGQNRTRAAELLGISVRTLRNKLNARPERPEGEAPLSS